MERNLGVVSSIFIMREIVNKKIKVVYLLRIS
jgi:hypothetical protein